MNILEEMLGGTEENHMGACADGAACSRLQNATSISAPGTGLRRFNFRYGDRQFVNIAKLPAAADIRTSPAQPYTSLSLRLDFSSSAATLVECPFLGEAEHAHGNRSLGVCSDQGRFSSV
jgi:hypothetical protein